jgi:hypothetical protein
VPVDLEGRVGDRRAISLVDRRRSRPVDVVERLQQLLHGSGEVRREAVQESTNQPLVWGDRSVVGDGEPPLLQRMHQLQGGRPERAELLAAVLQR